MRIRTAMIGIVGIALLLWVAVWVCRFLDPPYSIRYNYEKMALVKKHNLIGATEARVVEVLGKPTVIERSDRRIYYDYRPFQIIHASSFEVFFLDGVVDDVEELDD